MNNFTIRPAISAALAQIEKEGPMSQADLRKLLAAELSLSTSASQSWAESFVRYAFDSETVRLKMNSMITDASVAAKEPPKPLDPFARPGERDPSKPYGDGWSRHLPGIDFTAPARKVEVVTKSNNRYVQHPNNFYWGHDLGGETIVWWRFAPDDLSPAKAPSVAPEEAQWRDHIGSSCPALHDT
jgi:hypothetical protein